MTEDAKLKQVMNKINDAISWIKQLNCIVLNSINTELNPDDGSVLLYLQTPNNLIVPSRSEERRVGKECRSRWSPYH